MQITEKSIASEALQTNQTDSANSSACWSREVEEFSRQQHVAEYLRPVIEMTQQAFPSHRRIVVTLDEDPEIADDRHILLTIEVGRLEVSELIAAQDEWFHRIFEICPSTLVCLFRFSLDRFE